MELKVFFKAQIFQANGLVSRNRGIIYIIYNNRALSKFKHRSLHYLISIMKSQKQLVRKKVVARNRWFGNTGRTGRSTHLCLEPSYTGTHASLPGIKR